MLENKLALVTGAASGIGKCIAEHFAKNGANLALVDMSSNVSDVAKEIEKNSNIKVTSHKCDVSDSNQVNDLFNEIEKLHSNHKCPNIIVNCAGIYIKDEILIMNEENFDKIIDVNLKGTFLVTKNAAKRLVDNFSEFDGSDPTKTYASIINLSSISAERCFKGFTSYSASKAGVDGLTKSISKELGKYKIRVNSIQPGLIQTPMTAKGENKDFYIMMTSLNRLGLPDDVAKVAVFLASENSSFVTGTSIECNGGMSC